ncbi:YcjF family protein [Flocculibacter collagenilyticus]|uniref:YcjF family protein n=1 Tax=Flocculibacter collagenilyticus TaxID=2744479 RepID=UPI0018F283BD|nr:TIGR01620 family protein [Flocculibacter collagenilyticus]
MMEEKEGKLKQQVIINHLEEVDEKENALKKATVIDDALQFHEQIDAAVEEDVKESVGQPLPDKQSLIATQANTEAKSRSSDQKIKKTINSSWFKKLFITALVILIGWELINFFIEKWLHNPALGFIYLFIVGLLSLKVTHLCIKEYKNLRRLRAHNEFQKDAYRIINSKQRGQAESLCLALANNNPQLQGERLQEWQSRLKAEYNDKDVITLFSKTVLSPIDKAAYDKVVKYASDSAVMVALSPVAFIDMLAIVWRNLKMIEDITELYGIKLGYWGRIGLLKDIIKNMVFAGSSELLIELSSSTLTMDLASKISTRAAQGVGAGILTARLGLRCINKTRPIALEHKQQKKLHDMAILLFKKVKSVTSPKKD